MIPNFDDIALLVIDVQDRLVSAMPEEIGAQVVNNIDILADLIGQCGGMSVYTEQYPKGLGSTVETLKTRLSGSGEGKKGKGGAVRVEKISFSCLDDERFLEQVLPTLPDDLIVVGMEAHICVLQTVLDLLVDDEEDNRMIYVPMDAVCSRAKQNWRNGLDQMYDAGVVLTNTETLVFQALGEAGSEEFKHFSKRVR